MGNLNSKQKNNLELYLNDVYEKECKLKLKKEEIKFIQTGIETLVQDIVDQVLEQDSFDELISEQFDLFSRNTETHIAEVYFPIQNDYYLQRYVAENASNVKIAKSNIIKVGSFYDSSKNNFPDEFDFIFPLLGIRTYSSSPLLSYDIQYTALEAISKCGHSLYYPPMHEGHQEKRKLYFEKFIGVHGPACTIQFIYRDGSGKQRPIHVDLVPAFRIIDSDTQQWFVKSVTKYVRPNTLRKEILSARSCLDVHGKLAFTEIEQHFIKNILSQKHLKVYRILKYLLNGNGDGNNLEELIRERIISGAERQCTFTSYRIKILMIYHHESCTNSGTEDLGPCILPLLEKMSTYECRDKFPSLTVRFPIHDTFCVLPYLESTLRTLKSMQTAEERYKYKRYKIKSVSGQYLDSETIQTS